jgi:lipoate-protein ligase A
MSAGAVSREQVSGRGDLGTVAASHLSTFERNLLAAHAAGQIGDQLWFHRLTPTVAIGCHQVVEREARQPYCDDNGIAVIRRITAGGALYLDPGQQCFSLAVAKAALGGSMADRLQRATQLVAEGLKSLGVQTVFKAPNDLQIEGRQKIASVFLAEQGASALVFASIIAELDLKGAMQALLVPTEKLTVTGLEHAKERMTSLATILGQAPASADLHSALAGGISDGLGLDLRQTLAASDAWPESSNRIGATLEWDIGANRFETKDKVEGATLRMLLGVDESGQVETARLSTDGHFAPDTALDTMSAAMVGVQATSLVDLCRGWFAANPFDSAGFGAGDVLKLVERAVSKLGMQAWLGLSSEQASGVMLAGTGSDPAQTLEKASVMLVPYCAKPNWCKWRHTIDCVECGECEVGDAYAMARDRNMEVITITNFEHLADTLDKMKGAGVDSYVGMCCGEFFLKRHHAFRNSGMDAVLLDIEGATCYELKEEHLAYAGAFKAEARLDLDAVTKVMDKVPVKPAEMRPCISGILNRPGEKNRDKRVHAGCGNCGCGKAARPRATENQMPEPGKA